MIKSKYESVEEKGITFFFKYDKTNVSVLHIYARHRTTIDDALEVFFNTTALWNKQYQRYENLSHSHGLYWFWRNEQKKEVTVITCFRAASVFRIEQ